MTIESQATPAGQKESKKSKQEPLPKSLKGTSRDPFEGSKFITKLVIEPWFLDPETRQIFETLFKTKQFQDYSTRSRFLNRCISISFSPNDVLEVTLFFAEINGFLKDPHFVESLLELAHIVDKKYYQICPLEVQKDFYRRKVRKAVEIALGSKEFHTLKIVPEKVDYSLCDQGIDRKVVVKGILTIRVNVSHYCEDCINSSEYCQQCIMDHFKHDIDVLGKYSIINHTLEVTPTNCVKTND